MMPEALALVHVRYMHLDNRPVKGAERVENGNGGMRVGCGVDHDSDGLLARFLYPVDKLALVVALAEVERVALWQRRAAASLDIGKRVGAIDLWLALAEQVQVGSVQDEDRGHGAVLARRFRDHAITPEPSPVFPAWEQAAIRCFRPPRPRR